MQELGAPCKHLLNVPLSVCSMVPPEHLGDGMKDGHVSVSTPESCSALLAVYGGCLFGFFFFVVLPSSPWPGRISCIGLNPLPSSHSTYKNLSVNTK